MNRLMIACFHFHHLSLMPFGSRLTAWPEELSLLQPKRSLGLSGLFHCSLPTPEEPASLLSPSAARGSGGGRLPAPGRLGERGQRRHPRGLSAAPGGATGPGHRPPAPGSAVPSRRSLGPPTPRSPAPGPYPWLSQRPAGGPGQALPSAPRLCHASRGRPREPLPCQGEILVCHILTLARTSRSVLEAAGRACQLPQAS